MINLKQKHRAELEKIFSSYCPNAEVWAYGSRVNGDSHDGSDLDLTLKSFNEPGKDLSVLKALISDSNIPFLVDINEFDKLPDYFQQEILKSYVRLF